MTEIIKEDIDFDDVEFYCDYCGIFASMSNWDLDKQCCKICSATTDK